MQHQEVVARTRQKQRAWTSHTADVFFVVVVVIHEGSEFIKQQHLDYEGNLFASDLLENVLTSNAQWV